MSRFRSRLGQWVGPGAQFSLGSPCGSPSRPTQPIWFHLRGRLSRRGQQGAHARRLLGVSGQAGVVESGMTEHHRPFPWIQRVFCVPMEGNVQVTLPLSGRSFQGDHHSREHHSRPRIKQKQASGVGHIYSYFSPRLTALSLSCLSLGLTDVLQQVRRDGRKK